LRLRLLAHLALLPGLDGTGLLFRPLLRALHGELDARVIAYPGDRTLDLTELGGLVLRQLPPGKAILVAESFSGLVALSLLASSSARIAGVVFVGAFAEPPRPLLLRLAPLVCRSPALMRSAPSFLLRQYCLGSAAGADDLKLLRDALAAVSPAVLAQRLRLVGTRHSFGKTKFEVPCHYLRATEDRLVPTSCAEWFRHRFQQCEITEIEGPHFLLQAAPQRAAEAIARAVRLMLPAR
jgi:pimeloyl-[acyl-carrier protein] methyl ester esterase